MRLEHLGFRDVSDYVPGKSDWTAAGLPTEGHAAEAKSTRDLALHDVATCHFREAAARAIRRMHEAGCELSVALDDAGIVIGVLHDGDERPERLDDDVTVEDLMRSGPTSVRANEPLEPLLERMRHADVDNILVTTPEGRLIGVLNRADGERYVDSQADEK